MAQPTRRPLPTRRINDDGGSKNPLPPKTILGSGTRLKVEVNKLITKLPSEFNGEWYMIPTIGDGSCLIHSALQAVSESYRASTPSKKSRIADDIRIGMAFDINELIEQITLFSDDVLNDGILDRGSLRKAGFSYNVDDYNKPVPPYRERIPEWYQAEGGIFLSMFWQNINAVQSALNARVADYISPLEEGDQRNVIYGGGLSLRRRTGAPNELLIDYSLYGMTHLMNSNSYIGDELIKLVADYFNVNIVMLDCTRSTPRILHQTIEWETRKRDFIFIAYVPGHYQTIGRKMDDDEMQYCFPFDHELMAPFIPSDYDLGHGPIQWESGKDMEKPLFTPITLEDTLNSFSENIRAMTNTDQLSYVNEDDPAYNDLMKIEDFDFINYLPHYGIFFHMRANLATTLPSYYNLLRSKFIERGTVNPDEAEFISYLWPSIIDAPVRRTNSKVKNIPSYEATGEFPGENILSAIIYVYNLTQDNLLAQIEESGSIGQVILNTYNEMVAGEGVEEEEQGEQEE